MNNCCAVVVTFNRKELLLECLNGLLAQTAPLDHIVVIDNNSSDGTKELMHKYFSDSNQITYINLNDNLGGAGGFHYGVKWAFENRYTWFWLMDDDVEPEIDCLEKMLTFTDRSKCLHPTKRYSSNKQIFKWEGFLNPKNGFSTRFSKEKFRDREFTTLNIGCFEGMLIHKDIVDKIGLPDERFFIAGDDLIYGYLASKHTPVFYLRDPEFKKKILKEEFSKFLMLTRPFQSPFYLYFNTRNHFLKKDYFIQTKDGSPIQLNLVIVIKNIKLLLEVIFFFRTRNHLKMFFWGLKDGIKRNFKGHHRFIK